MRVWRPEDDISCYELGSCNYGIGFVIVQLIACVVLIAIGISHYKRGESGILFFIMAILAGSGAVIVLLEM